MSDNWVVQNLQNALETWNEKLAEIWQLITTTPQNFNSKMKRESFTISDLEYLAEAVGCSFERHFVLPDGEKV